uniref:Uncharacterized protein n=1 Tax=Nelumbo nucifera TaxID=4432 RepID=A0A822YG46_NELNU|nr:TPA_asm: hypothetical protein HUJ06_031677 [Nelumbo nucifera]
MRERHLREEKTKPRRQRYLLGEMLGRSGKTARLLFKLVTSNRCKPFEDRKKILS